MNQNLSKIKRVLSDPLRKPLIQIVFEMSKEALRLKRMPNEYLSRFCYRKGSLPLSNYVSDHFIGLIQTSKVLHSPNSVELLLNKLEFYRFCLEHDIPTAKILAYSNHGNIYSINDEILDLNELSKFIALLSQWIEESPYQSLFIKPNDLKGGVGAFKIDESCLSNLELMKTIWNQCISSKMIIQNTLVQHPVINAINPASINTVRMDTYQPLEGAPRIISACMRFGRQGSVVDNPGTSKGFFVKLNTNTHQLEGLGQQIITFGNQVFTHHPDTHHPLDGVVIPYIDEAIDLVLRATQCVGDRLIGWDVCVTPDGPLLIEGNHNYHIVMLEIANGGYAHRPAYQDVLKEVRLENA
ncbi:MAG: hypothetical protein KGZ51_03235 [Erysipelothrix sp.]|jgi:hypothetical protein|nr:hypothetical protein [Erysipelothrix sp.]